MIESISVSERNVLSTPRTSAGVWWSLYVIIARSLTISVNTATSDICLTDKKALVEELKVLPSTGEISISGSNRENRFSSTTLKPFKTDSTHTNAAVATATPTALTPETRLIAL